jgi:hypothetical protein
VTRWEKEDRHALPREMLEQQKEVLRMTTTKKSVRRNS